MGIARIIIALCAVPHAALALECAGTDPAWQLSLTPDAARFAYADRVSDLTIPQQSTPEGLGWPKALTLIGPRDSAIVILEAPADPQPVRILTQRGETPVLLVGTCTP